MQLRDYIIRHNELDAESVLSQIPVRKEYLLEQIGRGKRVLDVGCLGGQISRMIMDRNNEVWGVELNAAAAEVARKRGVRVKVADVEEGLPFKSGSFDVIHAGDILEHLYDTKSFLEEAHRVLNHAGLLLFTTPNLNSLENRIRVAAGGYLSMTGAYPEDHFGSRIRVFNLPKIQELCGQTGFGVEEVRGIFAMTSAGKWLDRSHRLVSRLLPPGLSKLLIVKARKVDALSRPMSLPGR